MRETSKMPWVMEPNKHHKPEVMERIKNDITKKEGRNRMSVKGTLNAIRSIFQPSTGSKDFINLRDLLRK